jgi:hypothetical protein
LTEGKSFFTCGGASKPRHRLPLREVDATIVKEVTAMAKKTVKPGTKELDEIKRETIACIIGNQVP